jgi:hypothetical protein
MTIVSNVRFHVVEVFLIFRCTILIVAVAVVIRMVFPRVNLHVRNDLPLSLHLKANIVKTISNKDPLFCRDSSEVQTDNKDSKNTFLSGKFHIYLECLTKQGSQRPHR